MDINWIYHLICWMLSLYLIFTALLKLTRPSHLYHILKKTGFWPGDLPLYMVPVILSSELFLGVSLLYNGLSPFTGWLILAFLFLGSLHSYLGYKFNRLSHCGCYGPLIEVPISLSLGLNLMAALLAILGAFVLGGPSSKGIPLAALVLYPLGFILVRIGWNGWGFAKSNNLLNGPWNNAWVPELEPVIKNGRHYLFILEEGCDHCKYWISKINLLQSLEKPESHFVISPSQKISNLKPPLYFVKPQTVDSWSLKLPAVLKLSEGNIAEVWENSFPDLLNEKLSKII